MSENLLRKIFGNIYSESLKRDSDANILLHGLTANPSDVQARSPKCFTKSNPATYLQPVVNLISLNISLMHTLQTHVEFDDVIKQPF